MTLTFPYTELELPRSTVHKLIKDAVDGRLVQKDAKLAFTKAATVFVSYVTAAAQEAATSNGQKTLNASHVLQAVDAAGFGHEWGSILREKLQAYQAMSREKASIRELAAAEPGRSEDDPKTDDDGNLGALNDDDDNTLLPAEEPVGEQGKEGGGWDDEHGSVGKEDDLFE